MKKTKMTKEQFRSSITGMKVGDVANVVEMCGDTPVIRYAVTKVVAFGVEVTLILDKEYGEAEVIQDCQLYEAAEMIDGYYDEICGECDSFDLTFDLND